MAYSNGTFLATPIPSIPEATTFVDGTDFNSKPLEIYSQWDQIGVICEVTGGVAGCALAVHFSFQVSIDGVIWVPWDGTDPVVVTMVGTTTIRAGDVGAFRGCRYMRLYTVENNEAVAGRTATLVQVYWGRPWVI